MVSFTQILSAGVIAFVSTASATSLHVNKGCIIANSNGLCAGNPPLYVNGNLEAYACIDRNSALSTCYFNGNIPTGWEDAYWGEDNCVYSAGSSPILVGCSNPTSAAAVPNPY